jgi:hypothetical protein
MLAASEAEASWIRIAAQMRHYEEQVKQADRASGELISKPEMQDAVIAISAWIRIAFQSWLSSETPNLVAIKDPHQFAGAARTGFASAVKTGFDNSRKSRNQIPEWIADIFKKEYGYKE